MKILSIRLKNLASLVGEHFIDFESEPLASAGLIAIVGKTGAGKSTLLDAMCLALFNKVPRLKDSDGKLIDADGSELAANASQTVLRRGTAHGFAELCFRAQDQKAYLVRWELKRARENPNGKLQNVQRYLKCLNDGVVLADKAKAVEEHIRRITQLSFEQFTRAVLLAQSEVTAFLKARDVERGELLEYLTNSNIFGKIGELAYKKTAEISKQRKQLEDVLGHIEILNDQDVAQLQQQLSEASTQCTTLEQAKVLQQQALRWFQQRNQLENQIAQKQQQHRQQSDAQMQLEPQRHQLSRLELFASIRSRCEQLQQQTQLAQSFVTQLKSKQLSFVHIQQQFEQDKQKFSAVEQLLNQQQDFEQQHQTELKQLRRLIEQRSLIKDDYDKCKNKHNALKQQQQPMLQQQQKLQQQSQQLAQQLTQSSQELQHTQQFSVLDQALSAHVQQLEQSIPAFEKIESQLGHLQQAKQRFQSDQQDYQNTVDVLGSLEQLEQNIEQQQNLHAAQLLRLNHFENFKQQLEHHIDTQNTLQQLDSQLKQLTQEQQQLKLSCPTAEQAYLSAQAQCVQLNQMLQQQRLLHTENIEKLRAELQADQACLVCGSLQHPYREDQSALSKSLFDLQQQQLAQAEQLQQRCFKEWQALQQQLTQCSSRLQHVEQQHQHVDQAQRQSTQALQHAIHALALKIDLNTPTDQIHAALQLHDQELKNTLSKLEHSRIQLSQTLKQQRELSVKLQQQQQRLDQAQQLQQQLAHIFELQQPDEQGHLSQHAMQLRQQLKQRMSQLQQQQQINKNIESMAQQQQLLDTHISSAQQQCADTDLELKRLLDLGIDINQHAIQLIAAMTGVQVSKATEWVSEYEQERQQTQQHYRQLRHSFDQQQQHFQNEEKALNQLELQSSQAQTQRSETQAHVDAWLEQHAAFDQASLNELLTVSSEQEKLIRQQLQQQERLVHEAATALSTITAQLQEHLKQQPEMSLAELEQHIEQNQLALVTANASREQFKLKLELHQQSIAKQQQFLSQIEEIQQQEHRWSKISGLMGDATGKKFRDFAQQYHLDILVEYANQQLEQLSQRYTLKRLDNSLSLAIIDHDMDGETRSVASLSGGESFLTALALSLAIANMASGSMKIESLFIDEGFGTLDASSLHMVMNALDQLQSQGRKVVLISHISDMHERIPVQIQVKPRGAGASYIEVVA